MSVPYQPFPIKEFRSGISSYLQPWIRPSDAFDPLVNAYVYRGTINKRSGMSQFGTTLADANPVMGIMRYINQTNGAISLLVATTVHLYIYDVGGNTFNNIVLPANFTGNITNFFNYTNWQPTAGGSSFIFMVNAKDPITLYDGTNATQPNFFTDNAHTITITTALDVVVYKQRLLIFRPVLSSSAIPENQTVYWSAISNPTNVVSDVAGNGGLLSAPTGDVMQSVEFLRDDIIVFFTNSTWILKFTGIAAAPFQWIKLNNSKSTNAPYGSVSYDERTTAIGRTGFIACDGVNVQRYDSSIIDYYETNFSQLYYAQSFSQRYDNLNQAWMLYVSNETPNPLVGGVAPGSDSALIYNFAENTWATYKFSFPLTCLGLFYKPSGTTWASLTKAWEDVDQAWNSFAAQQTSLILLAGGTNGKVYLVDDESQVQDNGNPILVDIVSTRWNPIIDAGQKVQFGYIDIYYNIASVDPANPISLTINFFVDNSENTAATRTLTLDGPINSEFYFKRIYLNLIGEFVRLEFAQPTGMQNSFFQLLGFILWVRPAGRLTP